ncbi:MAG: formylglycine-generating enzyme family protein [Myxococcales bacterium]|nr:MAG: formylglycine-generating enzyme family protein [Myxococcales bacterium]
MKNRTFTLTCLSAALLSACGHLDLGDYAAELPPQESNGTSVIPSPGGSSGSGGMSEPAGGHSPRAEGGAESAGQPASGGESTEGGAGGMGGAEVGGAGGESSVGGESASRGAEKKSCLDLPDICGKDQRSCCEVRYVSAGEVVRGGVKEGEPSAAPSHVSAFYLSTFEVTVGRFQAFLDDYDRWRASGAPRAGDGNHPLVPGSGWRTEWLRPEDAPEGSTGLAATSRDVEREVTNCMGVPFQTKMWIQPLNCASFYEAQAFCTWDGGRLPTDLEWEYAAAGGSENRTYPWGTEPPSHEHAMYGCSADIGAPCLIPPVGSYLPGAGRFGQLDLAGSLAEWTFDTVGEPFPTPCSDCANVEQIHEKNPRNTRGGSWTSDEADMVASQNHFMEAYLHLPMHGIRCAYDVPASE